MKSALKILNVFGMQWMARSISDHAGTKRALIRTLMITYLRMVAAVVLLLPSVNDISPFRIRKELIGIYFKIQESEAVHS